ncbi:MAG: chorismate mutase [Pseudomonas sp.]|uniref:chorismate mutase n=1 Tax=Pseudomonas TaxID=286 RepID=UPI00193F55B8|nr:chorismate mutase [Pseudomonas arcuscaelestis]MBM3104325.1 chorismate mutase [Pseudomonas arcuscaelestis]
MMTLQGTLPAATATILQPQRDRLDVINNELVELLCQRMQVCMVIAELKAAHGIAMMQPQRITQVLDTIKAKAVRAGLNAGYVESIFRLIIEETCVQENQLINQRLHQEGQA